MANKNLLDIHKELVKSQSFLDSGFGPQLFMQAATSIITPALQASQDKLSKFLEELPADFNMAKVPPELRDKLKEWTVSEKKEYSKLAKEASTLDPQSPRYQEIIDEMNEIRYGFENVFEDINHLKVYRDQGVSNSGNRSKFNTESDMILQNSIVNGEGLYDMTFDRSGVNTVKDGELTNIKKVTPNQLVGSDFSDAYSLMSTQVINNVTSKDSKFSTGLTRNAVMGLISKLGDKNSAAFAFDGLIGDETDSSTFIDKHITTNLGIKKYDEDMNLTKEYEDMYRQLRDPSAFATYKDFFVNHLVESLSIQHTRKVTEYQDVADGKNDGNSNRPTTHLIHGNKINKQYSRPVIKLLNSNKDYEQRSIPWMPQNFRHRRVNGQYELYDGNSWIPVDKEQLATNLGIDHLISKKRRKRKNKEESKETEYIYKRSKG